MISTVNVQKRHLERVQALFLLIFFILLNKEGRFSWRCRLSAEEIFPILYKYRNLCVSGSIEGVNALVGTWLATTLVVTLYNELITLPQLQ